MEQSPAESKFAIAIAFVSMRKQSKRVGGAQTEEEAKLLVDERIGLLRKGVGVHGFKPSEVYSVFAYSITDTGLPDTVVKNVFVRERKVDQETAAAA